MSVIRSGCRCTAFPVPVQTLQHRKRNVIEYCLRYFTGCRRIHLDRYRQRTESFRWNRVYVLSERKLFFTEFLTNTISCLCERGDSLWLGTDCGVYIFERKPERIIPFRPVAADSLSPIRSWVTKIVCDPQGNVWIATRSQGVFRYANGKQLLITPCGRMTETFSTCCATKRRTMGIYLGKAVQVR